MPNIEQSVKSQFVKVFGVNDWMLFKEVADFNLAEAACLKTKSLNVPQTHKLLVRNARKRLFIGIGVELLLKAAFLRQGFGINTPRNKDADPRPPYKLSAVGANQLDAEQTFTLGQLLNQLPQTLALSATDGLKIAKVFRNKEGHSVTASHRFDPDDYRKIEAALIEVYQVGFGETLKVRISMKPNEKGIWRVQRQRAAIFIG